MTLKVYLFAKMFLILSAGFIFIIQNQTSNRCLFLSLLQTTVPKWVFQKLFNHMQQLKSY